MEPQFPSPSELVKGLESAATRLVGDYCGGAGGTPPHAFTMASPIRATVS